LRNILTFVAVALVTALTVALVAPPLIDWSARREMVARAIAVRINAPVEISGPVTLRLLPQAFLEVDNLEIGPHDAPWLKAQKARFEFSLFSLFGGKIRLDDVAFDHPTVRLGPKFEPPGDAPLEFAKITARHADIRIERAGASPIVLADMNFDGAASSPRGPFRGGGDFAVKAARANFQLAAESFEADRLPMQAEISSAATRADFGGQITLGAAPSFEGKATILGEAPAPGGGIWPVHVEGVVAASGDQVEMTAAAVRLGTDPRALEAEGALTLRFGDQPALDADLQAKTLNFDSILRRDKEAFAPPSRLTDAFTAVAAHALGRDGPLSAFSIKMAAGVAYLGARPLAAPKIAVSGSPGAPLKMLLQTGLPGQGRLSLDGSLELGAAPIFRGNAQGAVSDFEPLAAWIAEGQPALAQRLETLQAALPNGAMTAEGAVEVSPEGFSGRGLKLDVATSHLQGDVIYQFPLRDSRGRLFLDIASDALDIEVAPNIEAGLDWLGDTDLDFSLAAKTLRVARVGLASLHGGSLAIRARKDGAKFALERLSLADLGGASVEVEGETSPAGRWTRLKLDAGRLNDFAFLLVRAAPNPLTRWLLQHAGDLGSAKATVEARRDGPPLSGAFPLDFLKADGEIAASRFGLVLTRAPTPTDAFSADVKIDAPDMGGLLRRLGAKIAAGPPGRAQLSLSGSGRLDQGFAAKAKLNLAGAEIDWRGDIHPEAEGQASLMDGPLTVKSADLLQPLSSFGLAAAGSGAAAPAELSGALSVNTDGARLSGLSGALAGSRVNGELVFAAPAREALSLDQLLALAKRDVDTATTPPQPVVTGALEFDRASAGTLLSLLFGRPGPVRPGEIWSQSKFGPSLLSPPLAAISLKVGLFDFGVGLGKALSTRFEMDKDRITLEDAKMSLNGGSASGTLSVRRDRAGATVSGSLALAGVSIDRPALHAKFDADLDIAGAGESGAGLVGGLAATGHASVAELRLPHLDPDGLGRAMTKIDHSSAAPPDEARLAATIGAELDRAPLTIANAASGLASSAGALHFGPFDTTVRDGSATVSGALGLADLSIGFETTSTSTKTGPFWSEPPPTVEIATKGTLEAVSRKIDVSLLFAGLAAEAVARESDRIANFEADVRERAAFNRRLKAERFLARREAEIAAFEDERERKRLMDYYLEPYSAWAASRRDGLSPSARLESGQNRSGAKDAAASGL
jgi:hypothetical protein